MGWLKKIVKGAGKVAKAAVGNSVGAWVGRAVTGKTIIKGAGKQSFKDAVKDATIGGGILATTLFAGPSVAGGIKNIGIPKSPPSTGGNGVGSWVKSGVTSLVNNVSSGGALKDSLAGLLGDILGNSAGIGSLPNPGIPGTRPSKQWYDNPLVWVLGGVPILILIVYLIVKK